jgi:hypothetical protein
MTGAIVITALFAVLSSAMATIGNFAMERDFSDVHPEKDPDVYTDPLFDPITASRYAQYKLTANLFYYQALLLWTLLALLAGLKLLLSIAG